MIWGGRGVVAVFAVLVLGIAAFVGGLLWGADDGGSERPGEEPVQRRDGDDSSDSEGDLAEDEGDSLGSEERSDDVEGGMAHQGDFFELVVPDGWGVTASDEELSYGWRTQLDGPDGATVRVEVSNVQPPANSTESAQSIGAAVSDRLVSGPEPVVLDGAVTDVQRITFRGRRGDNRVDYFFTNGNRGYAVLAVAPGDVAIADTAARNIIATLKTTG